MILYFNLEWFEKRPHLIEITTTPPQKITFQCQFKSNSETNVIVCGNFSEMEEYIFPKNHSYTKPQYLLSHLQKAVRRMECMKSIKTAKHLLDLDPQLFLRRLPIIMMEDVQLHPSISIVIWLMIAVSKKYTLKQPQIKWLLGVVYSISNDESPVTDYSKIEGFQEWDMDSISKSTNTLLYSLRFRQNYGGMKGDLQMIEDYIQKLLTDEITLSTNKIPVLHINTIQPLSKKDWIYQANDFHCNRSIPKQVSFKYPKFSQEYCKQLIWENSSSLNQRHNKTNKVSDDWKHIKPIVKYFQKNCIFY